MKGIKDIIDLPLSYIINNSFCNGVFPDMLKYARVTPLYKGGEKCEAKNYRPVSILPIFDKIFEKVKALNHRHVNVQKKKIYR